MPSLEISLAFFATALLLGIAPGPDIIFVLTQSTLFGARAGIATTLGLVSGATCQTIAVAIGVAAILQTSAWGMTVLKFGGAGYLCWLAWQSFKAGASKTGHFTGAFPGYPALYRRGIILNLTNPKVLLFFLAFLPQFCVAGSGPFWFQILYFGMLFVVATLIVFCTIACLGGRLATIFNKSPKAQIYMHRAAACVFIGMALALVLTDGSI